ncbi:hypothetical protein FRB94_012011 [Tulasnella sp. JGI-2019a]|nr:hypothetical protein FRB94_012011 [Tulasnella sp. JGI-2019a]
MLKSIRLFHGLSDFAICQTPLWNLEVLEQMILQFGEGLESIRGLKVLGRDVTSLLRLLHTWCPFVKTIHSNIDPTGGVSAGTLGTNSDSVVAALRGFLHLEKLFLTVDYSAEEEATIATITQIAQNCPKLCFVEWRSATRLHFDDSRFDHTVLKCGLKDGSWSCLPNSSYIVITGTRPTALMV